MYWNFYRQWPSRLGPPVSVNGVKRLHFPTQIAHMPTLYRRRAARLATQAAELGFAVPEVIAHRLTRMALAGFFPSSRDRQELYRMGAEKVLTFYESWNGMLLAAWHANLQLFFSAPAWSASWVSRQGQVARTHLQRTALDILHSGVSPIHRRAVANAKRLRTRRESE